MLSHSQGQENSEQGNSEQESAVQEKKDQS